MSNEEEYYKQAMERGALEQQQLHYAMAQQDSYNPEPGMIKEQLSLGDELEIIDHLLNSRVRIQDSNGNEKWIEPIDEDMKVLSPFGVHHFRSVISGYIHKNKLLSNYDEDVIKEKMYDIANTINDDFFLMYEKIFYVPSVKWCIEKIKNEQEEELTIKKEAYRIAGLSFNEKEERKKLIENIEEELEEKIRRIREESLKEKIKKMNFIVRFIQDTIHDTYLRAFGGQERRSLRQTMSVTEAKGGFGIPGGQTGGRNKQSLGWFGLKGR